MKMDAGKLLGVPRHFELRIPILLDQQVLVCHDEPLLVSIVGKDSRVVHGKVALLCLVSKSLSYDIIGNGVRVGVPRFSSIDISMQVRSFQEVAH